jgi:hypothetical protein
MTAFLLSVSFGFVLNISLKESLQTYHVITLSAIGEADTPAGGSVCMRCLSCISTRRAVRIAKTINNLSFQKEPSHFHGKGSAHFEITHQAAASGCRHPE